jgi:hypothetical protein
MSWMFQGAEIFQLGRVQFDGYFTVPLPSIIIFPVEGAALLIKIYFSFGMFPMSIALQIMLWIM